MLSTCFNYVVFGRPILKAEESGDFPIVSYPYLVEASESSANWMDFEDEKDGLSLITINEEGWQREGKGGYREEEGKRVDVSEKDWAEKSRYN